MEDWWLAEPAELLSQGDLLADVVFAAPVHPPTGLKRVSLKGGKNGWAETDSNPGEVGHFLARGVRSAGMIVSHSCELDKARRNQPVLVAPVKPLAALSEAEREIVIAQQSYSLMPLLTAPEIGPSYVNLRGLVSVDRAGIDSARRIASLSDAGLVRLQSQVLAFVTRKQL